MTQPSFTISPTIQRQYILGKQGLWLGRRWAGKAGVAQALTEMEALQMDPVSVIAPSKAIAQNGIVKPRDIRNQTKIWPVHPAHLIR